MCCVDFRDFIENFQGDTWINNGPGVITRVLHEICKTTNPAEMTSDRCDGFRVYQPTEFYAVSWEAWYNYFNRDSTKSTLDMTKDSLAIHVWNKLSENEMIEVGSNVAYGIIAEKNCPRVYRASGKFFWKAQPFGVPEPKFTMWAREKEREKKVKNIVKWLLQSGFRKYCRN